MCPAEFSSKGSNHLLRQFVADFLKGGGGGGGGGVGTHPRFHCCYSLFTIGVALVNSKLSILIVSSWRSSN